MVKIVIVIGNSIVDYDYDYIDTRINNDKRCLLYPQTMVTMFAYTPLVDLHTAVTLGCGQRPH